MSFVASAVWVYDMSSLTGRLDRTPVSLTPPFKKKCRTRCSPKTNKPEETLLPSSARIRFKSCTIGQGVRRKSRVARVEMRTGTSTAYLCFFMSMRVRAP